ncbi:protein kinase [bacterium]|nr:protein kinase [bacterium]
MSSEFVSQASSALFRGHGGQSGDRSSSSMTWVGQAPGADVIVRLVESWDRGEPVPAERLIAECPQIDDNVAVELIYEEIHLKREAGIDVRTAEIYRQFPQYESALKAVLEFDRLLDSEGARRRFPKPGDRLGPFELVSVLGEGASGRTYVALESSLADRPVVLKVMPVGHVEHLNLARLQHTHIMPLYSEMVLEDQGLRILVMPYLGGSGLDRILKKLAGKEFSKRSGRDILETIDRASIDDTSRTTVSGSSRAFFEHASFPDAIAHIGLCLADAAAEAHSRGLVHMDIKPSNVLISADARPVLLDFHLARAPVRQGDRSVDRLGGTPGWTSPEQNACFQAAGSGLPMPSDIDGRSDIYAIGAIMAFALRIDAPARGERPVFGPEVSVGLGDIVRKCLVVDPAGRYANAFELAEDLRRQLAHAPLRGVPNRSFLERLAKWRARNPTGIVWILAAGILISAIGFGLIQIDRARLKTADEIRITIEDARRLEIAGLHDDALERLARIKMQALDLPGLRNGIDAIETTETQLRQSRSLAALNDKSERFRLAFRNRILSGENREKITEDCRKIWSLRDELIQAADFAADRAPESRDRVKRQLIEIAVLLADLTVREESPNSRREATMILAEAEDRFGPQFALSLARVSIDSRAAWQRDVSLPPALQPSNAWEYDQLGQFHFRNGRTAEAADAFEKAVMLEPGQFWYQFDLAICRHERSEWQRSLTAWAAAVALRPDSAICRFDRGFTFESMGRIDDALADYLAATQIDKTLSIAALHAAILRHRRGEESEALELLDQVSRSSTDDRLRKKAWARIVAIHAQAGRTNQARDAIRAAAERGLIVGDPNAILPEN